MQNPIIAQFEPWSGIADGEHVYDFLGVKTSPDVREKYTPRPAGTPLRTKVPTPNTSYFELETVLDCVLKARDQFVMAELGAGWGLWSMRAAVALRRISDMPLHLISVEADESHYHWLCDHFRNNGFNPEDHRVLHGAATAEDGVVEFPKLPNPEADYGAAIGATKRGTLDVELVQVPGYSIPTLLKGHQHMDLLHIDVQGEELKVLQGGMDIILEKVRVVYVATHSTDLDREVARLLKRSGLMPRYRFQWRSKWDTIYGPVQFKDGCHVWINPNMERR